MRNHCALQYGALHWCQCFIGIFNISHVHKQLKRAVRIIIGGRRYSLSFKIYDGIVEAVPSNNFRFALGYTEEKLRSWLKSKHIPFTSFGFKERRDEVLLFR